MPVMNNFAFGLPSKPRQQQPCMFEILSMNGECSSIAQSRYESQQPIRKVNQLKNCDQIQQVEQETGCCLHNLKNTQQIQIVEPPQENHQQVHQQIYKQHQSPNKESPGKNQQHNSYMQSAKQGHHINPLKNSTVFPKEIKHGLYSYEKADLKGSRSKSVNVVLPTQKDQVKETAIRVKANQEELDQATIEDRKKRIKEFEILTRELPNTAFTTYYGKPAFEAYGRGSSCRNLKSHNVMPHRGENHPKVNQTHYAALLKGRSIKTNTSYLPRKPVDSSCNKPSDRHQEQMNINIPLHKPDLIHNVRFSDKKPYNSKKDRVPVHTDRPRTTQPIKPKNNLTIAHAHKKGKNKTHVKFNQNTNDGLKYLNKRDHLIEQLQDKKTKASQLAFKVTECYPLEWNCSNICKSYVENQNWQAVRPAGKPKEESDHVSDLFKGKRILQQSQIHFKK